MNASIRKFLNEEDGVTALEYGLLAAVIAGVIIAIGGEQISEFFGKLFSNLTTLADKAAGAGGGE